MLPQRVTIGTVEEIQKTTKTINLERAGGRGRIKCPGNAPALLYQSNNSSNDLCYLLSLSLSLSSRDVSVRHAQLSVNLHKHKERPMVCDFFDIQVVTLALIHTEPLPFSEVFILKTKVGCRSCCNSIYQFISP